jgi:hypothetical protein
MRLTPSPAQRDIVDSTDEYLTKELPISRVREAGRVERECAVDAPTWRRSARLGFFSLGLARLSRVVVGDRVADVATEHAQPLSPSTKDGWTPASNARGRSRWPSRRQGPTSR